MLFSYAGKQRQRMIVARDLKVLLVEIGQTRVKLWFPAEALVVSCTE
ncbi:MAG: hypothetical protein HPY30_14115 [Gammaproteobacteria bacterium (ex Lamellibrachia satsuma)]|nr:MAG: hypothetical protein HPY30_14115 [Gammaproteobacteria bacterium (ex Lamellibrachia satsuma)]